jgi:flagellar assembly factor FliW
MRFDTTRFGMLEIDEKELINFPWGIPGFEELKLYVLLEYKNGPFQWLQSVEEPSLAFVVCPPGFIGLDYRIPESKIGLIKLEQTEDLLVLNIVSFNREKGGVRFHARSPLIFNVAARVGYQWTMEADELKSHMTVPAGSPRDLE